MAPMPPANPQHQVISVVIGAVLAVVAVVIIAVLLAILVLFIMNRRREDQKMLCDVPHIVAPRAQNLGNPKDNPIFTGGSCPTLALSLLSLCYSVAPCTQATDAQKIAPYLNPAHLSIHRYTDTKGLYMGKRACIVRTQYGMAKFKTAGRYA